MGQKAHSRQKPDVGVGMGVAVTMLGGTPVVSAMAVANSFITWAVAWFSGVGMAVTAGLIFWDRLARWGEKDTLAVYYQHDRQ